MKPNPPSRPLFPGIGSPSGLGRVEDVPPVNGLGSSMLYSSGSQPPRRLTMKPNPPSRPLFPGIGSPSGLGRVEDVPPVNGPDIEG